MQLLGQVVSEVFGKLFPAPRTVSEAFRTKFSPDFHLAAGLVTKEEVRLSASQAPEWCWQIVGPCLWGSAELQEPQLLLLAAVSAISAISAPNTSPSISQIMMGVYFALTFLLFNSVLALPQNFEDIDLASDQPDGEVEELIISCNQC